MNDAWAGERIDCKPKSRARNQPLAIILDQGKKSSDFVTMSGTLVGVVTKEEKIKEEDRQLGFNLSRLI